MSPISSIKQDDDTDQKVGDDQREDTGESTLSSDIAEGNLDNQQEVPV